MAAMLYNLPCLQFSWWFLENCASLYILGRLYLFAEIQARLYFITYEEIRALKHTFYKEKWMKVFTRLLCYSKQSQVVACGISSPQSS
jgi:hypothetical protein